jgi:hypothetical protein
MDLQPPIHWVPGLFDLILKVVKGMKLTTHLHLVPVLRMHGGIPQIILYLSGVVLNLSVF